MDLAPTDALRQALRDRPLPLAAVDLAAFDANLALLLQPLRAAGKRVRLATKSLRCGDLLDRAARLADGQVDGLMTFTARETLLWAQSGRPLARDLLLGYPPGGPHDADLLAQANRHASAAAMVDDPQHVDWLQAAAERGGVQIPVWLDIDMGWRPLAGVHIGVRRSPLHGADAAVALARTVVGSANLRLAGVMGYEAHVAGLPDRGRLAPWQNPFKRLIKRQSWPAIVERRVATVAALHALAPELRVNGGGSGSVAQTSGDPSVTEVTIGSGLLCGHLFDGYAGLPLRPALFFALAVARVPAAGLATCHGGGWIASGAAGADRLPMPVWPVGARLLDVEGAGEVQTPLRLPEGARLQVGDAAWFRPAKSGELGEVFGDYWTVDGTGAVTPAQTYRGAGWRAWA